MSDAKGLNLTPVDGRTVRLNRPVNFREVMVDKDIVKLYRESDDLAVVAGTSVVYRKTKHKVNIISRGTHEGKLVSYDLKCALLTSSSTFALSFLGGNRK